MKRKSKIKKSIQWNKTIGKTTVIVMLLLGSTWGCNQDEAVVLPREEMKIQPQDGRNS